MKAAVLFSGGKDSVFAAFWAIQQGFEVGLLAIRGEKDSMMFHHPNIQFCKEQAECIGLQITFVDANNENELEKMKEALKEIGAGGVVAGAIESEYQKQRIDGIAEELGIASHAPLWRKRENLLMEMWKYFEIYIVSASAEGMGEEWLGRKFDENAVEELRNKKVQVHEFFEGGEAETFVADAPFFKKRIEILEWERIWEKTSGTAKISNLKFVEK